MSALGRFVFRYRNLLFPLIVLVAVAVSTPGNRFVGAAYGSWLDVAGAILVSAGLGIRAITIGFEYVVRGGRGKQVYADRLVVGGVYAHTRNPMYFGNLLIVLGFAVVLNAPQFYLLALPLMTLLYGSIIAAEESYLHTKFGKEFEMYCARVPRFVPRVAGFARSVEGMRFNWRRVLVKDYSTQFSAVVTLVALGWWHDFWLHGDRATWSLESSARVSFLILWLVAFVVVWRLKKTRRLEADVRNDA